MLANTKAHARRDLDLGDVVFGQLASWVDLDIGDYLFGEKEQARLLAGEQLPCLLLVCSTS